MVLEAMCGSWKDESLVVNKRETYFEGNFIRVDIFIDQNYAAKLNDETGLRSKTTDSSRVTEREFLRLEVRTFRNNFIRKLGQSCDPLQRQVVSVVTQESLNFAP